MHRALGTEGQAWWCADVVHISYSACTALAALCYVAWQPRALLITWVPSSPAEVLLPARPCDCPCHPPTAALAFLSPLSVCPEDVGEDTVCTAGMLSKCGNMPCWRRVQVGLLPDLLVCISAGFFGFQLWMLVRNR